MPAPQHPLIALINGIDKTLNLQPPKQGHVLNFYKISYRLYLGGTLKYGQTYFDFNDGGMLFAAPNQIIGINRDENDTSESTCIRQQITLLIHPDFLLNYANRFYKRQFITRKAVNNTMLEKLEDILEKYFNELKSLSHGIPTVQYLAGHLNISPGYLSDMLRSLTGQNTQQHIHNKLIEKEKEKLSTSNLSISEIAYELGSEHSQSFSKLFKTKTKLSPLEFRQSFN